VETATPATNAPTELRKGSIHRYNEFPHPNQIIGCQAQLKHPSHQFLPAIASLSLAANRFQPSVDFFDSCSIAQAPCLSFVPCGSAINSAVAAIGVLSYVWRDIHRARLLDEIMSVIRFVRTGRHSFAARQVPQHIQCRFAFCRACALGDLSIHGQPIPILHKA